MIIITIKVTINVHRPLFIQNLASFQRLSVTPDLDLSTYRLKGPVDTCIYIYIYRERERYTYIRIYICVYLYIYIYIHRERDAKDSTWI